MKATYNWLKEFANIAIGAKELATKLTFAGLKIEGMETVDGDSVFDFEIAVNRPDWLSVMGIARETAALLNLGTIRMPTLSDAVVRKVDAKEGHGTYGGKQLKIVLEDPDLCPQYCGQIITGVKIGPSPAWIAKKLEACGIRPISNVVDITNLVMLELGQPLHAFDYDKITQGTIVVRRARNEKLMMIDDKERMLTDSMLAIADPSRVVAVGGVMGGKPTEVTDSTTTLLLESAYFTPASIRQTAKKLEMSTDASYRFERGADPNLQALACRRASCLFQEIAGGKAYEVLQVTAKPFAQVEVPLRNARIERMLGIPIKSDFVNQTLSALGFSSKDQKVWQVPSYRVDIQKEIDLIEEIARHYGYNNFPDTLPAIDRKHQADYPTFELERRVAEFLRAAQIDEAYTYSFTSPESKYAGKESRVKILNPISEAATDLRTSILPGLYEAVEHNLRHGNETVRLFEIGRVFLSSGEKIALGIAITGDYRELKGIIEAMLIAAGYSDPNFSETQILAGKQILGSFHPAKAGSTNVIGCEIYLSDLQNVSQQPLRYQNIIPYPSVVRDITFVLDSGIRYSSLENKVNNLTIADLRSYKLADIYKGPNTPPGKLAYTFRFSFQRADRTLTSEEVDILCAKIVNEFATAFGAELRK